MKQTPCWKAGKQQQAQAEISEEFLLFLAGAWSVSSHRTPVLRVKMSAYLENEVIKTSLPNPSAM